jgi:hypothetical protein
MDGFEEDFADADGAAESLPGLGVLPTERTTFAPRLQFQGLPEIVREDLLCCCESCEQPVAEVLWIPDSDTTSRPDSAVLVVDGQDVVVGTGCVMELPWKDGTFYFLNT